MLAKYIKANNFYTLFVLFMPHYVYSDESVVQIALKKPINIVSDKFISFSMDVADLKDVQDTTSLSTIANSFGPAYLKLVGPSTNYLTLDDVEIPVQQNQFRIKPSDWRTLSNWMRSVNFNPVVALPYQANNWKPRDAIKILGMSNQMGITNCIWQLGAEFNITDAINYVDDLQTLRTILDAFNENKWNVVGSDISIRSEPDEAKLFTELSQHIVESIGWIQSHQQISAEQTGNFLFERNHVLRGLQRGNVPLWLNVPSDPTISKYEVCKEMCINNGLQWAQTLGNAAQNGFKVVFKSINADDIVNPSLSYYVTLLHKKVVGDKVFESKIINGDKELTQFYTHCSRNISGSFTVMAINFAETKTKLSTKLQNKYTGNEVMQYILTVDTNGIVNINSEPVNSASIIDPVMKLKRPNRPTSFSLPPRSIGFWMFPSANFKECIEYETENVKTNELRTVRPKTSSELLLQQLIAESVGTKTDLKNINKRHAVVKKNARRMNRRKREIDSQNPIEIGSKLVRDKRHNLLSNSANMMDILDAKREARMRKYLTLPFRLANKRLLGNRKRSKRHIGFGKLFERLELAKRLNMPPIFNIGKKLEKTPVISSVHDVYKGHSTDKMFKSSENRDLPRGDVFFEIKSERNDEYVDFDETVDEKPKAIPDEQHSLNDFKNEQAIHVPQEEQGFYEIYAEMAGSHGTANSPPATYGELYESDVYQNPPSSQSLDQISAADIIRQSSNIKEIVQERQPSWQENQENLRKAKESLKSIYIQENQNEKPTRNPSKYIKSDEDKFFITKRRKRSLDQNFNDQIEQRVSKIDSNKTIAENKTETNSTADALEKISLLDKITRLVASLEKIDNLTDLTDLGLLANEIKEIEDFLLKKSQKLKLFNKPLVPIHQRLSRTEDIPKKCKILAMNLEKQCLRDITTFPSEIVKREVPRTKSNRPSKIFRVPYNSRRRRSSSVESPWIEGHDQIHTNMIPDNPDSFLDIVVPSINSDVIQRIPNVHTIEDSTRRTVTTRDEDIKHSSSGDGSAEYSPKFMKSITSSVESLMEILSRQVSHWWQML